MKIECNRNTRLSDDLRQIFISAYGLKLEMIRLCRDHPDPLLYEDKKPVLNISQDEFIGIFNVNTNRCFLTPVQACRLGNYCRLPIPNLIALVMKAEWESFLSGISGSITESGSGLTDQDLIERYISDFKPNPGKILKLIKNNSNDSNDAVTYVQIDFIINDLMEQNKFLWDNCMAGEVYSVKGITEELFLLRISKPQKEKYLQLKELWKTKSTELDDFLMCLERKKRLNLGLENRYFRTFGNYEAEKSKLTFRLVKYQIILEIMHENPEFTYRELIRSTGDKLARAEKTRNDLKSKITRSRNCIDNIISDYSRPPVSEEFRNSYMLECKKMLRRLFFLLHTDTCPDYAGLSLQKKKEINRLWLKLMKSSKDEIYSFSPSMLLYSLPDYEQLESIYRRACEILGIDPDCFETGSRLEFMIRKGTHPDKLIVFLESETEQFELHLARLDLIKDEYTHEDQAQKYRDAMENINIYSEKLGKEISDLKDKVKILKKQISDEFIKVTN